MVYKKQFSPMPLAAYADAVISYPVLPYATLRITAPKSDICPNRDRYRLCTVFRTQKTIGCVMSTLADCIVYTQMLRRWVMSSGQDFTNRCRERSEGRQGRSVGAAC